MCFLLDPAKTVRKMNPKKIQNWKFFLEKLSKKTHKKSEVKYIILRKFHHIYPDMDKCVK